MLRLIKSRSFIFFLIFPLNIQTVSITGYAISRSYCSGRLGNYNIRDRVSQLIIEAAFQIHILYRWTLSWTGCGWHATNRNEHGLRNHSFRQWQGMRQEEFACNNSHSHSLILAFCLMHQRR